MRQFFSYTVVSAICLGVDTGILLTSVKMEWLAPGLAGALGYGIGLLLHFVLSVMFVFPVAQGGSSWKYSGYFAGYLLTGLVGTLVTYYIIHYGSATEVPLLILKGFAVAVSYILVYLLRKYGVFRQVTD